MAHGMTTTDMNDRSAIDDQRTWFFIIGCQRSGTTLMRLILECHSRIQCCDEQLTYRMLANGQGPVRERSLLGLKAPCLTEQFGDATWWDALVLPEVRNQYCGQKLIFMVRDVRDTIASMLRLRVLGTPWTETHLTPSLEAKLERDDRFVARYRPDIARLKTARHPALARAAFYWRYKNDALFDYLERGFPVLMIRYEELVTQPAVELLRVCGFLQVPWEPGLLRHSTFVHPELDGAGRAIGGTDASRPIDTRSVGIWRNAFTDEEVDEILDFAGSAHDTIYPGSHEATTCASSLPAR